MSTRCCCAPPKVRAEGDLDFRGTWGVDKPAAVGFNNVRLRFELDTNADQVSLATLVKLTERYCVVYQTLKQPPPAGSGDRTDGDLIPLVSVTRRIPP